MISHSASLFDISKRAAIFLILSIIVDVASSGPVPAEKFVLSTNLYRIPYADGLTVTAFNDHSTHPNAPDRVDMGAGRGTIIVAAASGIVRAVVDTNGNGVNSFDDQGNGLAADGVTFHTDALEHSCTDSATVVGSCTHYNNYMWIQHVNGEWTKYSHLATGSATARGWAVGMAVGAGEAIGLESDIGAASGSHLHFEVAVPSDPLDLTPFSTLGGFVQGTNVVARVCFASGDANGDGLYTKGEQYTAAPCPSISNDTPSDITAPPHPTHSFDDFDLAVTVPVVSVRPAQAVVLEGSPCTLIASIRSPTRKPEPHTATVWFSESSSAAARRGKHDGERRAEGVAEATFTQIAEAELTTIGASHTTRDNGEMRGVISVVGSDGGEATAIASCTVVNVAPSVRVETGAEAVHAGALATLFATVSDPGELDTHTGVVEWGDGSPSLQGVTPMDLKRGIAHVYPVPGVYVVFVTVTDNDGGVGVGTATFEIIPFSTATALA